MTTRSAKKPTCAVNETATGEEGEKGNGDGKSGESQALLQPRTEIEDKNEYLKLEFQNMKLQLDSLKLQLQSVTEGFQLATGEEEGNNENGKGGSGGVQTISQNIT